MAATVSGEAKARRGAAVRSARRAGVTEDDHLRLVLKPGGDAGLLSGMLTEYSNQPDARRVEIGRAFRFPAVLPVALLRFGWWFRMTR